ncbi:SIMPL domain-containing protein [Methylophaga sp.]|uniref:SIMPL domain-containing protein n=1 Tax=Methylophaga sp. TaxID=2024840 RepID=UPI003F6A351B
MKNALIFLALLCVTISSHADDHASQYGMINLDASATADVVNDELITRLQVIEDGHDPAKLTNLVNKKTALVLDAVKNFKDIKAETSSYNTRPLYDDGEISSWKVTQQLTLETSNFEQMSKFIADISSLANIQTMQFQVSAAKAETVKQDLLKQAIANFKQKATLITTEFNRSDYELVSLSIDGNNFTPMPVMERSAMMSSDSMRKGTPAALSGGSNEVSVQVRGTIQLNPQ